MNSARTWFKSAQENKFSGKVAEVFRGVETQRCSAFQNLILQPNCERRKISLDMQKRLLLLHHSHPSEYFLSAAVLCPIWVCFVRKFLTFSLEFSMHGFTSFLTLMLVQENFHRDSLGYMITLSSQQDATTGKEQFFRLHETNHFFPTLIYVGIKEWCK